MITIEQLNAEGLRIATEMKRRFPELSDSEIKKMTRFIVLSTESVKASEEHVKALHGAAASLTEKGYDVVFTECAKVAFELTAV